MLLRSTRFISAHRAPASGTGLPRANRPGPCWGLWDLIKLPWVPICTRLWARAGVGPGPIGPLGSIWAQIGQIWSPNLAKFGPNWVVLVQFCRQVGRSRPVWPTHPERRFLSGSAKTARPRNGPLVGVPRQNPQILSFCHEKNFSPEKIFAIFRFFEFENRRSSSSGRFERKIDKIFNFAIFRSNQPLLDGTVKNRRFLLESTVPHPYISVKIAFLRFLTQKSPFLGDFWSKIALLDPTGWTVFYVLPKITQFWAKQAHPGDPWVTGASQKLSFYDPVLALVSPLNAL